MSTRPKFPDLPPIWLAAFMAAVIVMDTTLPSLSMEPGLLRPIGFLMMAAGVGLIFWAGKQFFTQKTPIEPGHTPKTLLKTGPFALNRNPIYTGFVIILVGFSVSTGVLWGCVLAILYVQIITKRFILGEEAALAEAFGEEGRRYLSETRRW
ncbi:MAG: isoprenylcysteine carboxylmethyltransferase family protein [Pseudomonadota bacterium]